MNNKNTGMKPCRNSLAPGLILITLLLVLWPITGLSSEPGTAGQTIAAEQRIDSALWELETNGKLAEALEQYQAVATELESLEVEAKSAEYQEQQRVLAYAYLRIGNVQRQLGHKEEALQAEFGLAGLTKEEPQNILGFLATALEILEPIENWAGVTRIYGLRAKVHEIQGLTDAAKADLELQAEYAARVDEEAER